MSSLRQSVSLHKTALEAGPQGLFLNTSHWRHSDRGTVLTPAPCRDPRNADSHHGPVPDALLHVSASCPASPPAHVGTYSHTPILHRRLLGTQLQKLHLFPWDKLI